MNTIPTAQPSSVKTGTPESYRAYYTQLVKRGANWWYWIAALSLVDTLSNLVKHPISFAIGTNLTEWIDYFANQPGVTTTAKVGGTVASLVILGVIAFWGYICGRGVRWAFVVGMALYGLDGLLSLPERDWVGLGFHAYAIYRIGIGFSAALKLHQINQAAKATAASSITYAFGAANASVPMPATALQSSSAAAQMAELRARQEGEAS